MNEQNESIVPKPFDRLLGSLHGLPDVTKSHPAIIRVAPPLGVGGVETFIITTYRQREQGDTIFLENVAGDVTTRLILPPSVANAIARQRDQLTSRVRSKTSRAAAQARKERGELPGFMRSKKKRGKK